MADPRNNIFSAKSCVRAQMSQSSARSSVFDAIGKVGSVDAWNMTSASKIGQGLRTLQSVSDSVRTGCGSVPSVLGETVGGVLDAGASWVLNNVGIAKPIIEAVQGINPGIANQAIGQAKQIYQQVKNGKFSAKDIPGAFQDFQNLERLMRNVYTPGGNGDKLYTSCGASPYAVDLIARAPKYKFMYVAQFVFHDEYKMFSDMDFAFMVKTADRPNIKYQMEDVNYYNFRSKVITKTSFDDITMTFYDDVTNTVDAFYAGYMKATVPVSNYSDWSQMSQAEIDGMTFDDATAPLTKNNLRSASSNTPNTPMLPDLSQLSNASSGFSIQTPSLTASQTPADVSPDAVGYLNGVSRRSTVPIQRRSASFGELVNNKRTIIKEIRLFHIFEGGHFMNVYTFYNPRIISMSLDALDMAIGSEGSSMTLQFNYDGLFVDTLQSFKDGKYATEAKAASAGSGAAYSLAWRGSPDQAGAPTNPAAVPVVGRNQSMACVPDVTSNK